MPPAVGVRGDRPLDSPRVLARYLAATSLATAAGALLGGHGVLPAIEGDLHAMGGVLWFGRNLCSVLTVTTLGLLLGQRFAEGRSPSGGRGHRRRGPPELLAAVAFTTACLRPGVRLEELPLAFPLLGPAMWFALRFPTVVGAWHSALVGAVTVALTLGGVGPFAHVESPSGCAARPVLRDGDRGETLALSTGRDERDALGRELRRTEAEAVYEASVRDAIIGSMAEGLLVVDDAGELLVSNQAARDVLGAPSARGTLAAIPAQRVDGTPLRDAERPLARALRGESVRDLELRTVGDAGPRILADLRRPLPRDLRRDRARALVLSRDVTSEHAHREELSAFAGVVAHDLRNPLAAIDGWTEMVSDELEAGELDPDLAHEFVSRVRSSSARMHALIGDLLDHATSDARALDLTRVDVAAMVAEVAAARHAEGAISCGPIPAVAADPVLLRQVVDNLLGNALKYVAPGEEPKIEVTGRRRTGSSWSPSPTTASASRQGSTSGSSRSSTGRTSATTRAAASASRSAGASSAATAARSSPATTRRARHGLRVHPARAPPGRRGTRGLTPRSSYDVSLPPHSSFGVSRGGPGPVRLVRLPARSSSPFPIHGGFGDGEPAFPPSGGILLSRI